MRNIIGLWLVVALAVTASFGRAEKSEAVVDVVGVAECADCKEKNFDTKQAFDGLSVSVDCKTVDGHFKTRGTASVDESGHFKVSVPKSAAATEQCYAQLRSTSSSPCRAHGSLEATKLTQSRDTEGSVLGLAGGGLRFSSGTCESKTFWNWNQPAQPVNEPKPPLPPAPKETPCPPCQPKSQKPCQPEKENL